ncbi:MAG: hypothetical protein ACOCVM_02655 [Desulfovibrionaceae bacterium]
MQHHRITNNAGLAIVVLTAAALLLAAPRFLQADILEKVPEQVYMEEVEQKDLGDVEYLTGGVGKGERSFLERVVDQGEYDLKLVFAVKDGAYLADVIVEIRNLKGDLLANAVSKGPWFFVGLDPGMYKVSATVGDVRLTKKVQVPGRGMKEVCFLWER